MTNDSQHSSWLVEFMSNVHGPAIVPNYLHATNRRPLRLLCTGHMPLAGTHRMPFELVDLALSWWELVLSAVAVYAVTLGFLS